MTSPTLHSICSGEAVVVRASGGRSYEFRINGSPVYTVGSSSTITEITFDPLNDGSHALINNDFIDVVVYNLPLSGGLIDSNSCSATSERITFSVATTPSPTIVATNIVGNTFCAGQTVSFNVSSTTSVPSATFEYSVNGSVYSTISGTTFNYTFPNTTIGASDHATVTIRMSSGSCSTQVTTSLYLEESEITSVGSVTLTDSTICSGDIPGDIQNAGLATTTILGTNITYQWQQRADTSTSTWSDIPPTRGTSITLSFTGVPLTESTLFRRNIIATVNSQTCTEFGSTVKITVNPPPVIGFKDPSNSLVTTNTTYSICSGESVSVRAVGGLSYEFRINGGTVTFTAGSSNTTTDVFITL